MSCTMTFDNNGNGTLKYNSNSVKCRGMPNFDYTKDITLKSSDCYLSKLSKEYNVTMHYAVGPIQWKKGACIHSGSLSNSVGCVHLEDSDAKDFYEYVKGRSSTRITISYPW